jgi:pimeloyl-[acyl-carrier protein] methyl ester esterase
MVQTLFIHGFATGPQIWCGQVQVFGQVSDLEQVDEAIVVGWSMGGWKAIELCLEHPQKVKGLVLVSSFAKYVKSDDYPCGTPLSLLHRLKKRFKADYKVGMTYFYDLIFKDKSQHHLIEELPVPEKIDIEKWFERLEQDDLRPLLPQIKVPTLILHGDHDPIVPLGAAEYLRDRIKDSELMIFEGAGHAPFLEEPEQFNCLLEDFINERAS